MADTSPKEGGVGEPIQATESHNTAMSSPEKKDTMKTNPYADINLNDLEGDDVKLTCCQAMMAWEKRPIWTPKWVLLWLFLYCVWFTTLTVMMWFTVGQVVEIEVNYRSDFKCSKKPEQTDDDRVKEISGWCTNSVPQQSNAPMIEAYEIKVPKEMPSPIYMHYELTGFHQNHMRFVKSSGNWGTTQMLMTGHCMKSQEERESEKLGKSVCSENGFGDGAQAGFSPLGLFTLDPHFSTHLFAMYKYWHPNSDVGLFTKGCFPWWSTKDQDCVADPREGGWLTSLNVAPYIFDLTSSKAACKDGPKKEACHASQSGLTDLAQQNVYPKGWMDEATGMTEVDANGAYLWYNSDKGTGGLNTADRTALPPAGRDASKACVGGNRVFYPCGLAAKYVFNDTYALVDGDNGELIKLDETAEKIAFDYDYVYSIRNLDPEAKFKQTENIIGGKGDDAKAFDGYRFYEVMQMWLIHRMPPMVCANDPLRLASPNVHPDYSSGDVAHYPYAACTNYKEFSFEKSKSGARCSYTTAGGLGSMNMHNIGLYGTSEVDSTAAGQTEGHVSGCGQADQIPNPAGWGVENSHFLVWNRPSGLNWFKKKYANIDKTWKKGKKINLVIANRYNLKGVTGGKDAEDDAYIQEGYGAQTDVKKKVWFQNKSWVGGYAYAWYVPWFFGFVATMSWVAFLIILVVHAKDPRRLGKIQYLDWKTLG